MKKQPNWKPASRMANKVIKEIRQEEDNDCKHKFEVLHIKKGNAFDFVLYGCGKCGRMKTKSV